MSGLGVAVNNAYLQDASTDFDAVPVIISKPECRPWNLFVNFTILSDRSDWSKKSISDFNESFDGLSYRLVS